MRGWGAALATAALLGAAGCTTSSPDPPPPLELVVGGDPQPDAVPLARVALTEEQLEQIEDACGGADGIPVSEGDECARVTSIPFIAEAPACSDGDVCLTVWNTRGTPVGAPAVLQIVDDREESNCPEIGCIRQLDLEGPSARDVLDAARAARQGLLTPGSGDTSGSTDPSDSASPSADPSGTGSGLSETSDPTTGSPSGTATDESSPGTGTGNGAGPLVDPGGVIGDAEIFVEPPAPTP